MILLDGKKLSNEIAEILRVKIEKSGFIPTLVIVQVGNVEESNVYIKNKKAYADTIGARVLHVRVDENIKEGDLLLKIDELNSDDSVHGIIVQLPIPNHLNKKTIIERISPNKDVDGLHPINAGKIYTDDPSGVMAATPKGIITLLKNYNIQLEGSRVLVVGKSLLVGKPTAMLMLKEGGTVTIAHSKTRNLSDLMREHDIVVVAAGKAGLVTQDFVREGQVIVDVGINSITDGVLLEEIATKKLVGDVCFEEVSKVVSALSPVPGGVGPMTVASLFENLVEIVENKNK